MSTLGWVTAGLRSTRLCEAAVHTALMPAAAKFMLRWPTIGAPVKRSAYDQDSWGPQVAADGSCATSQAVGACLAFGRPRGPVTGLLG